MEQAARCWMLTKRKYSLTSNSCDHDSWEEQAFAEDAAGPLGGCIWPPRSYSCSFCRREFRSAQALGGHMNVHRRDRARLIQSPPLDPQQNDHQNLSNNLFHQIPNSPPNLGFQYPNSPHNQICTMVYSPNPNPDPPPVINPSRSSPSKSSVKPPNFDPKELFPSFSSPTKKDKEASLSTSSDRYFNMVLDPAGDTQKKNSGILESGCRQRVEEEEDGVGGCKRRRISTPSSLPFFVKSNSVDRRRVHPVEFFEIGPCSIEELDLELRLGDRPKGK